MNQHYWQVSFFSDPYRCLHSAVMFRIIIINSYNIVGLPHHIFRAFFIPFGSWVFWSHQHLGTALSEFSLPCLALWSHRTSWPGKGQTITTSNSRYSTWRCISNRISPATCLLPELPQRKSSAHRSGKVTQIHHASAFYALAWGHIFIVFEFEAGRVLTNHRTRTYFHLFFLQIFHLTIIIYAMVD